MGTTASVEYVSVRDVGIIPNEAHIINYFCVHLYPMGYHLLDYGIFLNMKLKLSMFTRAVFHSRTLYFRTEPWYTKCRSVTM